MTCRPAHGYALISISPARIAAYQPTRQASTEPIQKTVRQACKPARVLRATSRTPSCRRFGRHRGDCPDVYKRVPGVLWQHGTAKGRSHRFDRLSNPQEAGAAIRLSTGFGGGKTHTLIALYHLAKQVHRPQAPTCCRPRHDVKVHVGAVDARAFGNTVSSPRGPRRIACGESWPTSRGWAASGHLDTPRTCRCRPDSGLFQPGPTYSCSMNSSCTWVPGIRQQRALLTFY